ncbi:hypothetical protein AAG906_000935 [Vitis piasezkii]
MKLSTLSLPQPKGLVRRRLRRIRRGAPPSTVPHSEEAAIAIQPDAAKPSNAPVAEEEARGAESGPDAAIAEGALDEKIRRVLYPVFAGMDDAKDCRSEAMRAFISYHPGDIEEMRSKLERKGVIRAEADQLKEEKEALEAKYKGAEQENSQLKNEMDEL